MKTEDTQLKKADIPEIVAGARIASSSTLDQFIADILAPEPVDEVSSKPHID